ncbi:MAG: hypothetical protein M3361_06710 [Candidatus Tectomicrobia bacterium]|nr:hypothetical protein [Candidatus Tectomicrobia bacterium]
MVRLAQEHRAWGCDRMVGAWKHVGYTLSAQPVGNILKRQGLPPAPKRKHTPTWHEFIRAHMDVLVATDFFTAEVWTWCGLVTSSVLFFTRLRTREVHLAGVTPPPDPRWMSQSARNLTRTDGGCLVPGQYLIHDRDANFCPAFQPILGEAGVACVPLPPRSPHLHGDAARWVRSVKDEALSRRILFGERALRYARQEYTAHDHQARPHQAKGTVVLMPADGLKRDGSIRGRERLGGLLKDDDREAA